ncbi:MULTISPECIES: efflux RND transporter periplasmic adaptor subunit [unclassified Leptospira]|uniref:efflux RND transporter periplasmic adaptor subunit n=1 Tax=unclassified Leptospira TaxID=2633828 RepID=UPI0002BFDDB5|nr:MULTISPECIES: efflux RND transporter periplasmic adaptor subunit [unclassified Leptospira]EMK01997.1 HlyD family secretion protein [Leptospira sp. B5-022]MCR1793863.1 efflux RND transporter periplasmic adaptor subunit [Leptospira sp. id769339]
MKPNDLLAKHSFWLGRIGILLAVLMIAALVANCSSKKDIYYCPMHPHYTSDRPGTCPICNMDLVKKEDPSEHKDHSNSNISSEVVAGSKEEDHTSHLPETSSDKNSKDLILSFEKQQSIGIKTELASRRNLIKKISAYSSVAYDPELYSALSEYKEAVRSSEFLSAEIIRNLQLRLKQLGLSQDQIRVWTSGARDPSELILGGKSGRAHIYSQIYESDFTTAKVGLPIKFKTDVYPEKEFIGKIKSIDVILDKNNRTLRLRSEVSDPSQLLKPQMFGDAMIEVSLPKVLSVPTSAILDTGKQKIAYVQTAPDKFQAVSVQTGKNIEPWVEILSGVQEGQRVVTESTFLIDSEAKIRFGSESHAH